MFLIVILLTILQVRGGGAGAGGGGGMDAAGQAMQSIFSLVFYAIQAAGMWKAFEKAGRPGWAGIIPIYNYIVLLDIAGKEWWWIFIVLCVPFVGLLLANIAFAEKYGQGAGFAFGLTCCAVVFWPILGFGSSQFEGGRRKRRRPRDDDDDDDDDDRPRRGRDDDDDDDDDRPRRPSKPSRARDEEEDDEDRPRKKPKARDDDDDDEDDRRVKRRPRDDD
jgi:Family of unknown function (DUF5684)